jgi:5-methylcytosine-specific restriction endonuclease McrA
VWLFDKGPRLKTRWTDSDKKEIDAKSESGHRGKCVYCGKKFGVAHLTVDHKKPVARGGDDRPSNLQLTCGKCNSRKGYDTDGEFRRRYKLTPARQAKGPPSKPIPASYFDSITKERQSQKAKRRRQEDALWW